MSNPDTEHIFDVDDAPQPDRTEFIESVDGLGGLRDVKSEVEWYLKPYNTPDVTPRVQEVTEGIVGERSVRNAYYTVVTALNEQTPEREFRRAFERGIRILHSLHSCDRVVRTFVDETPDTDDEILIAVYEFPNGGSMLVYRKQLFSDFIGATLYGVSSPRDIESAVEKLTDGFVEITDSEPSTGGE